MREDGREGPVQLGALPPSLARATPASPPPGRTLLRFQKPGLGPGPCLLRNIERDFFKKDFAFCPKSCTSSDQFWLFQNFFIPFPHPDFTCVRGEDHLRPFGTHLWRLSRFMRSLVKNITQFARLHCNFNIHCD